MDIVIWIGGLVAGLFVLDRLLLWMEAKGWIYWRKVKRKSSGGGLRGGLLGFNAMFEPGAHHTAEAQQEQEVEDEDDGDDDGQRPPEDRLT
jgi:hypothetical protein